MKPIIKKTGKLFLGLVGILVGMLVITLIAFSLIYSPEYVRRTLRWRESDVNDYQKFPARDMGHGTGTFYFKEGLDEKEIRSNFETHPLVEDMQALLGDSKTQAFIVIQDDTVVYEMYADGIERDSIVTSFSVAKSFTSALIGIAVADGYIGSVNDPITNYIPELAERDPEFERITIRDLLMMSSGIKYVEFPFLNGDDSLTYYHPDLRQITISETEIIGQPGEYFMYNNYHPLLLGMILERATGQPVAKYLEEKIWQPIGMEFPGSWSLDESGFEKMESGINARAIDFAKFGRLFLNNGNWEGVQVIPEDWVAESIKEDPVFQDPICHGTSFGPELFEVAEGGYYQYMWYGLNRENGADDFFAAGKYGQYIYISPQVNLIIIRNGEQYGPGLSYFDWIEIFYNFASERMR